MSLRRDFIKNPLLFAAGAGAEKARGQVLFADGGSLDQVDIEK